MLREMTPKTNGHSGQAHPRWLQYLLGAYPRAAVSPATINVYLDQFAQVDEEVLFRAARAHVAKSTWWPQPAELWPLVREEMGARLDREPSVEELRALHASRMERERAHIHYSDEEMLAWERQQGRVEEVSDTS